MKLKDRFYKELAKVNRPGMDKLIQWLKDTEFHLAPASTQHHLAYEGGLIEHSLNVLDIARKLNVAFYDEFSVDSKFEKVQDDSLIITSLLHDLGKHKFFNKDYYVENILKSGNRSKAKPYERNKQVLSVPHEITALTTICKFINLTECEYWAILQHNGLYSDLKYQLMGKEKPLQMIVHFADMWASRVVE